MENESVIMRTPFSPPNLPLLLPVEVSHRAVSLSPPGQMVRGRAVLLQAMGEGRPCPAQLAQHRSCPVKPCYSWRLGPWSSCRLQVGLTFLLDGVDLGLRGM